MGGIRDILVLVVIVGSAPVCFVAPFFGALMWTFVSFLNPHRFTWGMASTFPVAEIIAIPTLAGSLLFNRPSKHFFSRNVFLLLILWAWFTFTTMLNTQMPEFAHFAADTWLRWNTVSKILLMALLTVMVTNSWQRLRWLLLVIAGSFGFLVLKAVPFIILTGGSLRVYGPEGTMVGDNNDLGLALNMTLPMFFFLAKTDPDSRIRKLMGIVFVAAIPVICFTYSRGALVGMAVILFLMAMTLRQRVILLPLLLMAALFAIFLTPEAWQLRMNFSREGALVDGSALQRLYAWTYSWNLAVAHPLTGGGFEAYTPGLYERYAPGGLGILPNGDVHGPHSIYFGVLAEHGFVGFFLYISLVISCFVSLRGALRNAKRWGDERLSAYARMLQFSLLAFLTSGAFLGRQYFDYFFTLVACTAIVSQLCRAELAEIVLDEPAVEELTV
jgi:probable O-glycosylation ligase (exosortase A-associated)